MAKKRKKKKIKAISPEELASYYVVRFTLPEAHQYGGTRFGTISRFSQDAELEAKRGNLLVSDCEIPTTWVMTPDRVEKVSHAMSWSHGKGGTYHWLEKKYNEAIKLALASKTLVHQLASFSVADGCAMYVVTADDGKCLTVEWRGYGGFGRYTEPILGWGCTIQRDRIEPWILKKARLRDERKRRKGVDSKAAKAI